jgi:phage-related protein
MANVYDITEWPFSPVSYKQDDVTKVVAGSDSTIYPNLSAVAKPSATEFMYYYSKRDHTSSTAPFNDSTNWAGFTTDNNSEYYPHFIWTPSYPVSANQTPRMRAIVFGDGYEQRAQDGINNILLNLSLSFGLRDANQTRAILHFLEARQGTDQFLFTPPDPYSKQKLFVCKAWASNYNFFDNYDITATFEEVPT